MDFTFNQTFAIYLFFMFLMLLRTLRDIKNFKKTIDNIFNFTIIIGLVVCLWKLFNLMENIFVTFSIILLTAMMFLFSYIGRKTNT